MNKLYFGDNLNILRDNIKDESVDLIYLDPPFNSKRDYNLLFKTPKGHSSEAQITAFEDSWHWGAEAETEYDELLHQKNTDVAEMIRALRSFLGANDMMAYLTMMANRLIELHRVLKSTGSIYLHCDPTASHYLKIVMDAVFGKENYRNEIIWQRTFAHNDPLKWGRVHDTILFYGKTENVMWNNVYQSYDDEYLESKYRFTDSRGRYRLVVLTAPGTTKGDSGKLWRDIDPSLKGRHWSVPRKAMLQILAEEEADKLTTQEALDLLDAHDYIYWPKKGKIGGVPEFKQYLGEGVPIQSIITDIPPVNSQAAERLGYPTQKPLALLERIIQASSNEGDVVLDPFCGCGTAVHAAQKLNRQWIGIDITVLAVNLIEMRMKKAFPTIKYEVEGLPTHIDEARSLAERDKYQFQWWACTLVGAQAYQGKKKGADGGIDGLIYFQDDNTGAKKIVVSVKGGENVSVSMIRDFAHVIDREKAAMGFFVTLSEPTAPMTTEAVSAGFYNQPDLRNFQKLQILTIEGLLNGTQRPDYPDTSLGALTHKKAQVEKKNKGQEGMF